MSGDYSNQPYDYASHSTNQPHDEYGALLNDHYYSQENNPNNQSNTSNNNQQDVAKKFLFSVEDFLDTVRKLKDDYDSNNGTLHNIGVEPTDLFNDLKYHLTKQNRIASDSLNRLLDGVKMLKKLKTRCPNAFTQWNSVDNLIQTVDATTKAHPDFNGIIAQREQEAKQRLAFLKRQQMQKQQQQSPYYGHGHGHGHGDHNYYNPNPPPNDYNYSNPSHGYGHTPGGPPYHGHGGPPPHGGHYRGPPPSHPHHGGHPSQERRTVYVYGFPRKWGPTELRYLFDCIGETEDVDVLKRKGDTAFIHYIYPADAREAVEQMNNSCPLYCKRPINVEMADKSRLGVGMSKSHICWLYNQRTCQMGMACQRQHVCLFCNGGHPRKQCTEVDKHFRKLRVDKSDTFHGSSFRCSDFEITIDDIPINAANERDLRLLFNSAGPITRIKIMKPRKRNMKVRAYMEFADQQSLNNALKLNGTIWMGDTISVRKSSNNYRSSRYNNNNNNDRYDARDRYMGTGGGNRSRSRERGGDRFNNSHSTNDHRYDRGDRHHHPPNVNDKDNNNVSSIHKSSKSKIKSIEVGGCIQKQNGKIIIERKYQLNEVCTLFNGVTGCYSRDCEKIHVCSLCEDETHSLPKCPRSNTKIGEVLMKQLQKGAAMQKIELNEKIKDKKRSFSKIDKKNNDLPPKKKMKLETSVGINNNNNDIENNKAKRITDFINIEIDYLLFVLDGNVWRRGQVVERENDIIKIHYLGWDSKYNEKISMNTQTNRISIYKPDKFYSEATINKNVKITLKDVQGTNDVKNLDIEKVKQHLKLCQLKNDGPVDLLRERLLNVTDEIKILDATKPSQIIDVNMRRIDELFIPKKKKKDETLLINKTKSDVAAMSTSNKDNQQSDKPKLQQLCPNYNSSAGCKDIECELTHECELCGSELHITIDCPNNNL